MIIPFQMACSATSFHFLKNEQVEKQAKMCSTKPNYHATSSPNITHVLLQ